MKNKKLLAFAVASILVTTPITTPVFAEKDTTEQTETHQKHESVVAPDNAITKDAAKQAALTDANISAEQAGKVKAHLSQMDGGTIAYKVKFTYEGTDYSYVIDAITGSIIDKTTSVASEKPSGSKAHGKHEEVAAPDNAIAKDVAKQAALTDASIAAEQAGKVKAHLSQMDDGTIAYKVKFTYEGTDYSYVIDAITGSIIDKTTSVASDQESHSHGKGKHGKRMRNEETDATKQETQTSL